MAIARSSLKTRKRSGGWTVVDEPVPAPTQAIVAGSSASEVPKPLSISLTEVVGAFQETLGGFKWRQFNEGAIDLNDDERTQLLKAILGDTPNVDNVRRLFEAVHVKNDLGWTIAGSCPSVVRIAKDFLEQKDVSVEPPKLIESEQKLLDRFNRRADLGVS